MAKTEKVVIPINRPCRVCKVPKAPSELDSTHRCASCASIKAAADAGMTYGAYQAQKYAPVLEAKYQQMQAEQQAEQKEKERLKALGDSLCRNCGGLMPMASRGQEFCCQQCRAEYEKKAREAKEREAIRPPKVQKPTPPLNHCVRCGKEIPRKNKYCSDTCKYLFNQERIQQRQKERKQEKAKESPTLYCRVCGKEILSERRTIYCSDKCSRAWEASRKRGQKKKEA